jgi:hypothetical protein
VEALPSHAHGASSVLALLNLPVWHTKIMAKIIASALARTKIMAKIIASDLAHTKIMAKIITQPHRTFFEKPGSPCPWLEPKSSDI